MKNNKEILKQREVEYNKKPGARVGDFLKLPEGIGYTRFTHDWGETIQTGNGSFYFGSGYCSFSGGLDSGVKRADLIQTDELKNGFIWFFDNGLSGANRGKNFEIKFRVFELKEGADLSGLPQIEAFHKKQIRDKAETITRINGNGKEYTLPLPEIRVASRELNSVALDWIKKQTGLTFIKKAWDYEVQPMKNEQITKLVSMYKFKSTFYNNSMYNNTLYLEFTD